MGKLLKIEAKRLVHNRMFLVALGIGIAISLLHFFMLILPASFGLDEYMQIGKARVFPGFLFSDWMGANGTNIQGFIYFLVLPLLATMAFADSYYTDKKTGFLKNMVTRTGKKRYFLGKYITVFWGAGLVVLLPLVLNFMLTAMVLPALTPEPTASIYSMTSVSMWVDLFYTHPFLYQLGYAGIIFVYSGILASIALIITFYFEHRFSVLLAPFLVYIFLYTFSSMMGHVEYSPFHFLQPNNGALPFYVIAAVAVVSLAVTSVWFVRKGVKSDVY